MVRRIPAIALVLLLLLGVSRVAYAQQTGSILVKAVDQSGGVIPGATVTVNSPVLPAPLNGVTDSAGVYRFPSLTVGTYNVRVSLQGFKTAVRDGLQVLQGQTVAFDALMSVGGMTEETTVKGEAPVVDTKSANVKVNIDKDLLEQTPGGKDIWSILQAKAPGIVFDAPDVAARPSRDDQAAFAIDGHAVGLVTRLHHDGAADAGFVFPDRIADDADVEEFAAAHSEQPSAWQVRKLCREGLLPDASMPGKRWKIPARLLSEPLPKVAVSFFLEKEGKRNG